MKSKVKTKTFQVNEIELRTIVYSLRIAFPRLVNETATADVDDYLELIDRLDSKLGSFNRIERKKSS